MSATARTKDGRRTATRDQGRVLLVSDDTSIGGHARALEEGGFVVVGVAGGVKALVALQRTRPHVVVADANLRGISAGEFARRLSEAQDAIPVVLVGGRRPSCGRRGAAMDGGGGDYFQLPADLPLRIARTRQLVAHKLTGARLPDELDREYP